MDVLNYSVKKCIFMLDCARKYLTPAWIKRLIDEISAVGYNAIILHFSEDMAMRLESKLYPWLAGGDHSLCVFGAANGEPQNDGKFFTQDEMADIVRHAQSNGLEVIPSFDSPGHMNYIVKKYNKHYAKDISNYFHKNGKVSIVHGSSLYKESSQLDYSRGIDITNPEAVDFVKSLYREFGEFFRSLGCTAFDIGGDELLGFGESIDDSVSKWQNLDHWEAYARRVTGDDRAVAYDAFLLYMNDLAAMLRDMGYESIRMWNDDAYRDYDTGWTGVVELDKSIEIQYWSPMANGGRNYAGFFIERGHKIYNFTEKYTYYTLYSHKERTRSSPEEIERDWNPYVFDANNPQNTLKSPCDMLPGAGMCLWTDTPSVEKEDELLENIRPYFTAIAKKTRYK